MTFDIVFTAQHCIIQNELPHKASHVLSHIFIGNISFACTGKRQMSITQSIKDSLIYTTFILVNFEYNPKNSDLLQ